MKLRNLIFSLFLAIGAIGFTACTGDDGDQGPQGEQGEQGEKGDPGDPGGAAAFYDFMQSWGSPTGEVDCSSPLLTGEGPFPGPALEAIAESARTDDTTTTDVNEANLNSPVVATCSATLFADTETVDLDGPGGDDPVAIAQEASEGRSIVLWKAGRAQEKDAEPVRKPLDDFSSATSTIETRDFVGGPLFATLLNNGPDEALERELLHTQCDVGADPPSIIGEWKAVQKTSSVTTYTFDTNGNPVAGTPVDTVTLLKVCVTLDAHPGVTKCFAKESPVGGTTSMQIGLYDGAMLHTVLAGDNPMFPATMPETEDIEEFLFGGADAEADADFEEVEALCALFGLK